MSALASEEFLKAHAVISRSWVMLRMMPHDKAVASREVDNLPKLTTWLYSTRDVKVRTADEYVKWYDHDDHKLFHVCADDHCQRYQGLSRAVGETVRKVIDQTWGQILTYDGKICDARFSKCCGGMMEKFSTCWQDKDYEYLQAMPDSPDHDAARECFCNTADSQILGQVLNNYDQETIDFYEWVEDLDPVKTASLIEKKSGVMTGPIKALEPLEWGESGRICLLRIVGELQTITVGKELEIRRILSESHLKSSAFEVDYIDENGEKVEQEALWKIIRLRGRGWGHGVGLCQIGAAVMAARGYSYTEILLHYYNNVSIVTMNSEDPRR
jgi:SpoIID/LytB domain protein